MRTIALDFDGVICQSLHGNEVHSEPPVPGALEALRFLLARYAVFILTARKVSEVVPWLKGHGFQTDLDNGSDTWNTMGVLLVTNRKLPAVLYLDDRGLRFWNWDSAIPQIEEFAV